MAAESLILTMIQKLERRQAKVSCLSFCMIIIPCFFDYRRSEVERIIEAERKVIDELSMVVDILRNKKLGEGRRLDYFISDLVEMADNALDLYQLNETYTFSNEIESIQSWITEIKTRMLKLGVDSNMRSESVGEGDDEDVVGLEKDVQLLLRKKIFNKEQYLSTLLVKGMAGIGKTTLARQLYSNAAVMHQFNRRAWVCVSSELTHKEVLMKLIQQVVDSDELQRDSLLDKMEHADNTSLQQMLHQRLQGMRYFIVLDDLPKQIRLGSILKALPNEAKGSRLVLTSHTTSRNTNIHVRSVLQMKHLDSNKSWQLFLKTINRGINELTSEDKFPKHLERKGREMLMTKCGGLPLAIKEVGKQLAKKRRSGSEWEQLLECIDLGSTLELLESFYDKLDPKLKLCFLRMAFYKENTTMREEKLTQIWVAGGVVSRHEYKSYLNDLINESVIEVKDKSTEYRINAVLHKLSIKKAEEEIGFEILSNNGNNRPSQNPRHRVIICSRDKFNYSMNHGNKHIVSLFFHGGGYLDASQSYWKSFEQLRILDLEDFGIKIVPESIGILMELRYLGLRNNYIQELPHSLGCLKKLEVVDIAQNFMVEVPDIIWELGSLRHLYMSGVICHRPLKIEALENLETLTYISVDNWTYELSGLQMMTRLCKLGIEELCENSDVGKLFALLAKLGFLDHLILRGFRFRSMPCLDELSGLQSLRTLKLDGRLARLPNNFPRNLCYLTLVNSCLDEDPMPLLHKLYWLKYLKLRNAYTGRQMVILHYGFAWLEVLCIEELCNLRNVRVEKGGMCRLKILEIHNCPYLDTLPKDILSMTKLNKLKMVTTRNIAKKIRKSGLISKIRGGVDINP